MRSAALANYLSWRRLAFQSEGVLVQIAPPVGPGLDLFKGRHFERELIGLRVRWYLRFKLRLRDLVEMMAEREVALIHTTLMGWVQRFAPVGEAWPQGRFEVFEEHLYIEVITAVLRHPIVTLAAPPTPSGPKVLLTTCPQELHGPGLLMVDALLALEGCTCV